MGSLHRNTKAPVEPCWVLPFSCLCTLTVTYLNSSGAHCRPVLSFNKPCLQELLKNHYIYFVLCLVRMSVSGMGAGDIYNCMADFSFGTILQGLKFKTDSMVL